MTLAYGKNLGKFYDFLNLLTDMSNLNIQYIGLSTLYNELENKGDEHTVEMMTLVYWMKTSYVPKQFVF